MNYVFFHNPQVSPVIPTWENIFDVVVTQARPETEASESTKENLRKELALYMAGGGRGRLLELCFEILQSIPPSSIQPERDFSVLRFIMGENRASLSPQTINDIFILRKAYAYEHL